MKKLIMICLVVLICSEIKAQQYLAYDSTRRHEITLSVLPVVNVLSGSHVGSRYMNFNFGYRYYTKKIVLRTAFVVFPQPIETGYSGLVFYDRTVGSRNVFYSGSYSFNAKTQLNIGIEKIYRYNRLIHGVGADLFVNNTRISYQENYFYRPASSGLTVIVPNGDTTNYNVDTLGRHYTQKIIGMGMQVFYSIRYQVTKRFYVSATIGPSFNFSVVNETSYSNRTRQTTASKAYDFDFPNVGFISDVSICYRF